MAESLNRMALRVFQTTKDIPIEAQTVIALRAFGLSAEQIAGQLGFKSAAGVEKLLAKYDPERNAEKGDAIRRLALSFMFERISLELLYKIKPKDLEDLPVADKITIAEKCIRAVQKLNAQPVPIEQNEEELIESLREERCTQ